jgi:hypothetical protein
MNIAALQNLSEEAFAKLFDAVNAEQSRRMDRQLCVGAIVKFTNRIGEDIYMRVNRINSRTLSGDQTDEYGNPHPSRGKWRASPEFCVVVASPRKLVPVKPAPAPHKPTVDDAW